jgi:hypothetical protein
VSLSTRPSPSKSAGLNTKVCVSPSEENGHWFRSLMARAVLYFRAFAACDKDGSCVYLTQRFAIGGGKGSQTVAWRPGRRIRPGGKQRRYCDD